MAVTFRNIIDRVLIATGEDELATAATALTTKYEKLVGALVNQIKEEIEDATQWRVLRQNHSASITGGTSSATITGANERSRLYRVQQAESYGAVPLVYDTTASPASPLQELDLPELLYRLQTDTQQVSGNAQFFALDHVAADALTVRVYPIPSSTRALTLTLITPQARLANSGDLAVNILITAHVLEVGAIWAAREERGEELGPDSMFSEQRYRDALASAVARDEAESGGMDLLAV